MHIISHGTFFLLMGFSVWFEDAKGLCQSSSNLGRDFVITFLEIMQPGSVRQIFITPASRRTTTVIVLAPESQHHQFTLGQHDYKIIGFENGLSNPPNEAIHVLASQDISVMGLVGGNCTDAFLALPTNSLGKEYIVASYTSPVRVARNKRGSEFAIIGTQATTRVRVYLKSDTIFKRREYRAGNVIKVKISHHEVVHFITTDGDFTGTHIMADKPIAVLSGSKCADVPQGLSFCDHMVEQLVPFHFWGSRFLTLPFRGRSAGDVFRVIGGRDNTSISVCGNQHLLNTRDFHEFEVSSNDSCVIISNKPIQVFQYNKGSSADNTGGDPYMLTVPALEHFHEDILFPSIDLSLHMGHISSHVNIVLPCSSLQFLTQNVFYISSDIFDRTDHLSKVVEGQKICGLQLSIDKTHHYFSFDQAMGMMAVVHYGHSNSDIATSFGLPLALVFNNNSCFNFNGFTDAAPQIDFDVTLPDESSLKEDNILSHVPSTYTPKQGSSSHDKNTKNGDYLAVTLILCMFSLVTIILMSAYIAVLKKRVTSLTQDKSVQEHLYIPSSTDGYIGLDGTQIAHRDYMTLNNSDDVWSMAIPINTNRAAFRNIQPAHSLREISKNEFEGTVPGRRVSCTSNGPQAGHRLSSQSSFSSRNNKLQDDSELTTNNGSYAQLINRDREPDNVSGPQVKFGTKDSIHSSQSLLSSDRWNSKEQAPKPPVRSLRRHHSVADKNVVMFPHKLQNGRNKLHRSASTPTGEGFIHTGAVHYHVPRNIPASRSMYDKPRQRTVSEGISPSGLDILLPPTENLASSFSEESPTSEESSWCIRHDDGYMSMRDASKKTINSKPLNKRTEKSLLGRETIDSDSMDYTELL